MKAKKMRRISFNSESGVILPIVIILMLALTITGLAFLNAGVMENSLVRRQIHKDQAFYLAEAGVEHARAQLGQNWNDLALIGPIDLGAGDHNASIDDTALPSTKRRVTSTGAVDGISKTVEVILRKPPTGSGIDWALTAGGDIIVTGNADIDPEPDPESPYEDKFVDFELGDDPGDGLSLFEEIFGVTQLEMEDIAKNFPNHHYDRALNDQKDTVENITWVNGTSEITTDTWSGSGIFIVNGDLKITGGTFEGILWVIGKLTLGAGNPKIRGAVFVECGAEVDTTLKGTVKVELDSGAIDNVLGNLGTGPVIESWEEL